MWFFHSILWSVHHICFRFLLLYHIWFRFLLLHHIWFSWYFEIDNAYSSACQIDYLEHQTIASACTRTAHLNKLLVRGWQLYNFIFILIHIASIRLKYEHGYSLKKNDMDTGYHNGWDNWTRRRLSLSRLIATPWYEHILFVSFWNFMLNMYKTLTLMHVFVLWFELDRVDNCYMNNKWDCCCSMQRYEDSRWIHEMHNICILYIWKLVAFINCYISFKDENDR